MTKTAREILDDFGHSIVNNPDASRSELIRPALKEIEAIMSEQVIEKGQEYQDHRNDTTDRLQGWNSGIACCVREQKKALQTALYGKDEK